MEYPAKFTPDTGGFVVTFPDALYSELRAAGVKKIDLARRLKCSPSQVDRLLDITHHSRLDQIEAAFAAIGKELIIDIRDRAA